MNIKNLFKTIIPVAIFVLSLAGILLYIFLQSTNYSSWVNYSVNEDKGLVYGLGTKDIVNFVDGEFTIKKTFYAQSDVIEIPYSLLKKNALGDLDQTDAKYISIDIKYKTNNYALDLSVEDSRGSVVKYNIFDQVLLDLINAQNWNYKTQPYSSNNEASMSLLSKEKIESNATNFSDSLSQYKTESTRSKTTINTVNWFHPQDPFTYNLKQKEFVYNGRARGPVVLEGRSTEDVLKMSFTKKDLNLYEGEDTARIIITDIENNQIIYETNVADDGNTKASNAFTPGSEKKVEIVIPNMKNRYFRLESQANVDTLFENYKVNTPYAYFRNYLFIANTPIYGLVTTAEQENYLALASNIKASVIHDTAKQTLTFDKKSKCSLNAINKEFQCLNKVDATVHSIKVPIPDAVIQTDGYLSPASQPLVELFPVYTQQRPSGTLVTPDTKYILGRFVIPERIKEGEYSSHVVIDLSTLDRTNFSLKIIAPDLNMRKNTLEIQSISIKPL